MRTMSDSLASAKRFGRLSLAFLSFALIGCESPLSNLATVTPIYAATSGGLSVYTGSGWITYTASSSPALPGNIVKDVVVSGSGATAFIYAATAGGLWVYNPSTKSGSTYTNAALGLGAGSIKGLFLGTRLYAATSAGLLEMRSSGTSIITASADLASDSVNGVYESASGDVYVATDAGLSICAGGKWQTCSKTLPASAASHIASNTVNAVFVDAAGHIFAATSAGLSIGSSGGSSWSTPSALASYGAITSVFVDASGNIYLGTAASGLVFVDMSAGYCYVRTAAANGLASDAVNRVFVSDGIIYAATAGGLSVSSDYGVSWKNYSAPGSLGGNAVYSVVVTAPLYSY